MKTLPLKWLHCYFFGSLMIFLGVQLLKFFEVSAPFWIFHYLNDFLVIPIVATICLHVVWWVKRDPKIRLGWISIVSLIFLFSVYFEVYLPQKSPRYTGDPIDVLCYVLGGIVFYRLQKSK